MTRPTPGISALESQLGPDLCALIGTIGELLTAVTPVSGARAGQATAFRLEFADGRVLKGRRVDTPEKAALVEDVTSRLNHRGLPRVVKRAGVALMTEWVQGRPLGPAPWEPETLRQCGALQGLAHTWPYPHRGPRRSEDMVRQVGARLERRFAELVERHAWDAGDAQAALDVSRQYAPATCEVGLTFGDFCRENLVRRGSGEICLVDTEELSMSACDYDLARTWYRWPMTRRDRQAYLDGYRRRRSPAEFIAHLPYWAVAAIVDSALFRERLHGDARLPRERLRALVRGSRRGDATETMGDVS